MSINSVDWPTASTPVYTPDIETDYNAQNENLEQVVRGYNAISLSNWDGTSTAPQVSSGSALEASGVFYQLDANETIGTSGASAGVIYLTLDDSSPYSFEWVDTAPTWFPALNGWYIGGNRFTGHQCTWDGTSSFTYKCTWVDRIADTGLRIPADGATGTYGTTTTPWAIPQGAYMVATNSSTTDGGAHLQINDGSTWRGSVLGTGYGPVTGLHLSDGVNYRIVAYGGTVTIYYRKLW